MDKVTRKKTQRTLKLELGDTLRTVYLILKMYQYITIFYLPISLIRSQYCHNIHVLPTSSLMSTSLAADKTINDSNK